VINWQQVKAMQVRISTSVFALLKLPGSKGRRRIVERNWKKAKEVGIVRGPIIFSSQKSGKAQAENFMNSVLLNPAIFHRC
jgi:hypothetical protein